MAAEGHEIGVHGRLHLWPTLLPTSVLTGDVRSAAARAAAHDANDSFVADNFADLKQRRVFSAGVPAELGGGGASHAELCALLREMAQACGSTALASAMHLHVVLAAAWRWLHERSAELGRANGYAYAECFDRILMPR